MTVCVFVFLFCMLATMMLGVPISQNVFRFLGLKGSMTIRTIHTIFGYWGFVLLGVHLGLHFKLIFAKLIKKMKEKTIIKVIIYLIEIVLIIYGVKLMIEMNIGDYLIGKASFAIPSGSIIISLIQSFIMLLSIAIFVYQLERILIRIERRKQ